MASSMEENLIRNLITRLYSQVLHNMIMIIMFFDADERLAFFNSLLLWSVDFCHDWNQITGPDPTRARQKEE